MAFKRVAKVPFFGGGENMADWVVIVDDDDLSLKMAGQILINMIKSYFSNQVLLCWTM